MTVPPAPMHPSATPTPTPTTAAPCVRITRPGAAATVVTLSAAPLNIGSAATCHLRLAGGVPLAGQLVWENGTAWFLNHANRQKQALRHGSRIQIAGAALEIVLPGSTPAHPAPSAQAGTAPVAPRSRAWLALPVLLRGHLALSAGYTVFAILALASVPPGSAPATTLTHHGGLVGSVTSVYFLHLGLVLARTGITFAPRDPAKRRAVFGLGLGIGLVLLAWSVGCFLPVGGRTGLIAFLILALALALGSATVVTRTLRRRTSRPAAPIPSPTTP